MSSRKRKPAMEVEDDSENAPNEERENGLNEESQNAVEEECDETMKLDESSDESSVSSVEDNIIDDLDYVLDQFSEPSDNDDDWYPESTPKKKKKICGLSSVSPSPVKSSSPVSAPSGQGSARKGKGSARKSKARQSLFPCNINEDKWKSVDEPDIEPAQPIFKPKQTPGPQLVSNTSSSPLQYFEMFFTKSVLQTIVKHTNIYGTMRNEGKKKPWQNISIQDLKSFIALVIYMGVLKCFSLTDYWKTSEFYSLPYPAKIMSRAKFFNICWYLHLSDPRVDAENDKKKGTREYDRLCRIKPLYHDIRNACKATFHPFQNVSIDERMVASKARHGLKQYMKNKPTKWGYKLFVLADSLSGYTWDFFIYEGKTNLENSKGICYDSVMILMDEKVLGSGYKLFVDNFYTSPRLFRDLLAKKIWGCGTVRANRIGHSKKQAPRGNIRWFREDKLLFVEWKDKRDVLMCSTFHKAFNGDSIKRNVKGADGVWALQDFPVPAAVLDYNKHMGGVDLSDALIGYYTVLHKTRKWYRSFFYHFVDIAVVNAFILYQQVAKMQNQKLLTQKAFREILVTELVGKHLSVSSNRRVPAPPPAPDSDLCPTIFSHMPKYRQGDGTAGRRICRICRLKTPVFCEACDATLCLVANRNCYAEWHDPSRQDDSD